MASLTAIALCPSARADATWGGGTSQDWNTASNWSAAPSGNLTINTATGNYPIITADSTFTFADVNIGSNTGLVGRLDQTAGNITQANVTTTGGNWFKVGITGGGTGTYNLADTLSVGAGLTGFGQGTGSLTVGKLMVGGVNTTVGTGTVNINTTGSITANSTATFSPGTQATIILGYAAGGSGTINLESGTVNGNGEVWIGRAGTGTVTQTGGTFNGVSLQLANAGGTGTWTVSNATINGTGAATTAFSSTSSIIVSRNQNNTQAGVGTLNVNSGGIVNSENTLTVAYAGSSSASGTLNVNSGGTVNVGTTTERELIVNQWDATKGNLIVNGGTVNLNANSDILFSRGTSIAAPTDGGIGTSVVTLTSGAINAWAGNGSGSGLATGSVVDLNKGTNGAANNTFNLDGGTLTINQVLTTNDNGTATFNFNGGTLKAAGASANFVDLGGASQTVKVKDGGAVIDSNGFDVTIPQALIANGSGGLTKKGAGTLTLAGANTFTGATAITNGVLALGATGSILSTTISFTLTDATFGQLSVLNSAFSFNGGINFNLAGISTPNSWMLFTGSEFGAGDLAPASVTSDLGSFTSGGGGLWTFSNGTGSWSFNDQSGALSFTAVPEPRTWSLTVGALLLLTVVLRQRRQRVS
jgi:hypothetical protein